MRVGAAGSEQSHHIIFVCCFNVWSELTALVMVVDSAGEIRVVSSESSSRYLIYLVKAGALALE